MPTVRKIAAFMLLLAGFAALPAWAQQTDSERADLARYQKYAEAPVDHVRYFQINGFQYLAPDTVALWFGVNKLYLLTVQTPCSNLAFANGIGLTSRNNMLYRNFDFITFDHQRCKILKIVPVDELKMKQDAEKARKAKGNPAPASSS
ncbi:MAG: hypothetical protein J0H27_03050 [Xanthomonadales bacterium]|nr:hypothetical protein [Xanthomonadales bacterium]